MRYLCAWCNCELPGYQSNGDERVSHGICEPCLLKQLPAELHPEYYRRKELDGKV